MKDGSGHVQRLHVHMAITGINVNIYTNVQRNSNSGPHRSSDEIRGVTLHAIKTWRIAPRILNLDTRRS